MAEAKRVVAAPRLEVVLKSRKPDNINTVVSVFATFGLSAHVHEVGNSDHPSR